jgi:photosynthetic reaction center cytochrome c subunit
MNAVLLSRPLSLLTVGVVSLLVLSACERPPVETVQRGFRGLGMEAVINPRLLEASVQQNLPPEPLPPAAPMPVKAKDVYQNVQLLGDLSITEFNRLMLAISQWVAIDLPEADLQLLPRAENLALDDKYTKVVARSMLKLTMSTNSEWKAHVADTGVTCYTCHRGQPVPAYVWSTDAGPEDGRGLGRSFRRGRTSRPKRRRSRRCPIDPLTPFLLQDYDISVVAPAALPPGTPTARTSTKQAEWTYALMMHISNSLNVNCTYCHNSRSFFDWDQSTPQRVSAWYAIRHVRDMNVNYIEPLTPVFPENRLGPLGDVGKVYCATCHQGLQKPLNGVSLLKDYPEFGKPWREPLPKPGTPEAGAEPAPEAVATTAAVQ